MKICPVVHLFAEQTVNAKVLGTDIVQHEEFVLGITCSYI